MADAEGPAELPADAEGLAELPAADQASPASCWSAPVNWA
jgi:hypothetical protein